MNDEIVLDYDEKLTQTIDKIKAHITSTFNLFVSAGYYLKKIRDDKSYEQYQVKDIYEYAKSKFNISRTTALRWMEINDRFSVDGYSQELSEEYKEYSVSQLQEMIPVSIDVISQITPDMTTREIRRLHQNSIEVTPDMILKRFKGMSVAEIEKLELGSLIRVVEITGQDEGILNTKESNSYICTLKFENGAFALDNISGEGFHLSPITETTKYVMFFSSTPITNDRKKELNDNELARCSWHFAREVCGLCGYAKPDMFYMMYGEGNYTEAYENEGYEVHCDTEGILFTMADESDEKKLTWNEYADFINHLSAYGTIQRGQFEKPTAFKGCRPEHACYTCSMECNIRTEERICKYSPMSNRVSCGPMNKLEEILIEAGEQCQFINLELAEKRGTDHSPIPCCSNCETPCKYSCHTKDLFDIHHAVPRYDRGCITGKSQYGNCGCCGVNGMECCSECMKDCDHRCQWYQREQTEEHEKEIIPKTQTFARHEEGLKENPRKETIVKMEPEKSEEIHELEKVNQKSVEECATPHRNQEQVHIEGVVLKPSETMSDEKQKFQFLEEYYKWEIWYEVEKANERAYRYELSNGYAIIVREWNRYLEWRKACGEEAECVGTAYYLLPPAYHYLHDHECSKTQLLSHLEKMDLLTQTERKI